MDKRLSKASAFAAVLILTACSEAPKTTTEAKTETEAKKEVVPSGPVSAKTAFYAMYTPARTWATDLLPLSLVSNEVPGQKNEDGKAAMWTVVFVSPSRREARTLYYSTVDSGANIHKGVNAGGPEPWSGATGKVKPFQITEFAVDSDAAYKTAYEKAESWVKKHPDKKCTMSLISAARFPSPVWYVLWGNEKSGYAAFVNATTGLAMK